MRRTPFGTLLQLSLAIIILGACNKQEDIINPQPDPVEHPAKGFFSIHLKAVITVGDVVYDSIPATFTITTWDANNVAHRKDTALNAGAQIIYLPKEALRYNLKMDKWGVTYEKMLNKADVVEGAVYQLGGRKEAKKLQWVTEERVVNGAFSLNAKQQFIYDAQGRINEVHQYATDPNSGVLRSGSSDIFLYGDNELWVNTVSKAEGTMWGHSAYTYDAKGRTIRSKHQYNTETQVYTNQHTSEGILMLMGMNATDPNGSRIALKFAGGNRVEEKAVITNYPTTVKKFTYDFNINPYVVIKMPSLYFEHGSKNNVVTEGWEDLDRWISAYKYDTDGYVTEMLVKVRSNSGQFENFSRTVYTY